MSRISLFSGAPFAASRASVKFASVATARPVTPGATPLELDLIHTERAHNPRLIEKIHRDGVLICPEQVVT